MAVDVRDIECKNTMTRAESALDRISADIFIKSALDDAEKIGKANPGKQIVIAYQNPNGPIRILGKNEGSPMILNEEAAAVKQGNQPEKSPYVPFDGNLADVVSEIYGDETGAVVRSDNHKTPIIEGRIGTFFLDEGGARNARSLASNIALLARHQPIRVLRWENGLSVEPGKPAQKMVFLYTQDAVGVKRVIMTVENNSGQKGGGAIVRQSVPDPISDLNPK